MMAMSTGCTSHIVSSTPTVPTRSPANVTPDSSENKALEPGSVFKTGQLQYHFQQSAIVQALTPNDSIHRVDTTRTTAVISVTFGSVETRASVGARIQIDSGSTTTGSDTSVPISSSIPLLFSIDTVTGHITPTNLPNTNVTQNCTSDSTEHVILGFEVLPPVFSTGSTAWSDTLESNVCRGATLLRIVRIASYTWNTSGQPNRELLRTTRVGVQGSGIQWQQIISVTGEGSATDTLWFDPVDGSTRLQQVRGSSRLQIRFRSPMRVQDFVQTAQTQLVLQRSRSR
jgi:hypothetical protein